MKNDLSFACWDTFLTSSQLLTMTFHWPCHCTVYVYVAINVCVILSGTNLQIFFLLFCLYLYCHCRSNYQREGYHWWLAVLNTLCDKVCQCLAANRWVSPGTPGFSTNKIDHFDITEILLKVALDTITIRGMLLGLTVLSVTFLYLSQALYGFPIQYVMIVFCSMY